MAQGQWVNIPGKGRRWQQPSGELMMTKPGFGQGEFFQTRAAELLGGLGNLLGGTPRYTPDQMRGLTAPGLSSTAPNAQQQNPALGRVSAPGTDSGWWLKGGDSPGAPEATDPGRTQRPKSAPAAQISPEERAYNEERSRIAQLTAQNPEFQNVGQLRNDLRDQGMAIWQQKYGATPMAQPGGAVGMNNPLMQSTFGYQAGSAPGQQMGAPTLGPSPLVPQVDPTLNPAGPNYLGGEGQPLMNFADPRFENMSPEEFQKLLNQVNEK
jgi:hypothetical protein